MPDSLARRVRAKYPGVYDDLSDAQLEERVRAKYPGVYDDIPRTPAETVSAPDTPAPVTPFVGAALATAKAAPGVLSVVNKGAKLASTVNPVVSSIVGSAVPGVGAAIGAGVPKAAGMLEKATAPARVLNTGNQFLKATSKAGPLMRGAGWLSRMANTASIPLTLAGLLMDAKQQTDALATDPSIDPAVKEQLRLRLARPFEQ